MTIRKTLFIIAILFSLGALAVAWAKIMPSASALVEEESTRISTACAKNSRSTECEYKKALQQQ